MPRIDFSKIKVGGKYTREQLSALWGYRSQEAITRGVVTPAGESVVIVFITLEKRDDQVQYDDELRGRTLIMEGERGHGSDRRLTASAGSDDVHLFCRSQGGTPFEYKGTMTLVHSEIRQEIPSLFVFALD